MKNIKIKETYLLMLIVFGLVSLSLYTTYALFTASSEINNVVDFTANLTSDSNIIEYEMVTIPAGEKKVIEVNITNSYTSTLYYGAWYEMVSPREINDDIKIGIYTEKNSTPGSGTITSGATLNLLVGISNDSDSDIIVNIGVAASKTSDLNLSESRIRITDSWDSSILVTEEYLAQHATTRTETVNLSYTTPGTTEVTLSPGTYNLETWGAQGGSYNETYAEGGKGGYSKGTLTLTEETTIYVNTGGKGSYNSTADASTKSGGGFNGGGGASYLGGGGGGASDIRIGTDSLYARVIVAGGGGGAYAYSTTYKATGGAGGGTYGLEGNYYSSAYTNFKGYGGTSTSGGSGGTGSSGTYNGSSGTFGNGGDSGDVFSRATIYGTTTYESGGGGGGGWYGGGGAANYNGTNRQRASGGGGGSGWVYTEANETYTSSSYTGGTWLLNASYYLTNAETIAGDQSLTDYNGSTVTGHSGNGAVKISGTATVTAYTIPTIKGGTEITILQGQNIDLANKVTIECGVGETGCSLHSVSITDTSSLAIGNHSVKYIVVDSAGNKYKYLGTVEVVEKLTSQHVLNNLNLTTLLKSGTPNFGTTATSDEGIYQANDDLGTSYYFRGASTRNYVKFANLYWRIIRINGDGSIRMIYDGTSAHTNGTATTNKQVATSAFNASLYNDNTYVGYMYGTAKTSNYNSTHSNTSDSTIKDYLENTWYPTISDTYKEYISDAIYCNDREVSTIDTTSYPGDGTAQSVTLYKPAERLDINDPATPVLTCSQANDRFTLESTNFSIETNGKLDAPVGLITADEVIMAGGAFSNENTSYYLYSGNSFWTMSPYRFSGSNTVGFNVSSGNFLINNFFNYEYGVRPVISIKASTIKYGDGSNSNPFRLEESI